MSEQLSVAELEAQLAEQVRLEAETAAELMAEKLQAEAINAKLEEERIAYEKRTAELKAAKESLSALLWDKQRAIRQAAQVRESLERQIEQAKRAEAASLEWLTLADRWDRLTMGAPWREWAKDHQMEGAKKITYEGRLILADTMGLGKTLTSLIAIDMIQAATKEASPDHPVEFGSMK